MQFIDAGSGIFMKKITFTLIAFLTVNLMFIKTVGASTQIGTKITANTPDVKAGETVEIAISLDNLKDVKKGIDAYIGTIEYDKNIFETVVQGDFTVLNNWEDYKFNLTNNRFVSYKKVGTKTDENIAKITLKVKEGIEPKKTTIKVKDVTVSEGKKDIELESTSVNINIVKEQIDIPTEPIKPAEPTEPVTPDKPNTGGSTVTKPGTPITTKPNDKTDETTKPVDKDDDEDLPSQDNTTKPTRPTETRPVDGDKQDEIKKTNIKYILILIFILLQLAIIMVLYFRHRSKNKDNMNLFLFLVGVILTEFIGTTCTFAYSFAHKGELNDDSIIDYADVSLIEMHLLDLKKLPDDKLENADMNSDGKITVTDLSILVQKLENTLDYDVMLSDIVPENQFPNKNQDITVNFSADVSYGAKIEKIVIDGKEYAVTQDADTLKYSLKLNGEAESGVKNYHITQALLDNGKKIDVDYTIDIEVLKDIPIVQNYRVEENKDDSKLTVLFDLVDKDRSTQQAYIEIYNDEQSLVAKQNIVRGPNRIEVEVEESKTYNANIVLNYNLSTDENSQEHIGTQKYEKELQLLIDYNFNISNIALLKEGNAITTAENRDELKLVFDSTNSTKHIPATVKIDSREYDVKEENDKYYVELMPLDSLGEKTYTIEEVVLSNGKKFELTENNSITINVIKEMPIISGLLTTETTELNQLKITFDLLDEDRAVKELSIILFDADDNEIGRHRLERNEIGSDGSVSKFLETKMTTKYKVKVIMSYNVTGEEKDEIIDEVAEEKEIPADPRVIIKKVTPNLNYVAKGGVLKLIYEIESNKSEDVTRILINNVNCIAVKLDEDKYEATLNVGTTSGIYSLNTTRLTFSDNSISTIDNTVRVDVLKTKPTIANFTQTDNVNSGEVTLNFDVVDQENTFIAGKAVLSLDGVEKEQPINKGHNEITFQVEPSRKYTLSIKASYDLDSNSLQGMPETDNRFTDDIIATKEIELIADYQLSISNIKTYNANGETRYFGKSEPIKMSFESTNGTTFEPVKAIINGNVYTLTKVDNAYHLTIDSHRTSGVKTARIEKLILNNSKELEVTENNEIKVTVLKDRPTVEEFGYKENIDGTITANFNVIDEEKTITGGKVLIIKNGTTVKEQNLEEARNTISFQPEENQNYKVKVVADYDLDMNVLEEDANEFKNMTLLEADITLGARKFELKDIIRTSVYKNTADGVVEVKNLRESELANLNDYIAKVHLKEMPTFYTTITGYRVENDELKLTLKYDNVVQYSSDSKQDKLEVTFGKLVDGVAENLTLEGLIKDIEANPTGTFTLTRDYDASIITSKSTSLISSTFMGKIDGNGHKIYNLTKPLFDNVESATIENLTLESPKVFGTTSRGTIANSATNSTIRNINIKDLILVSGTSRVGGLVGETSSTAIENISVTNFSITTAGHIRIAAIIGNMTGGSLRNCYIEGKVESTQTKDGNGISGVIGTSEGTEIIPVENCITKVHYSSNVSPRLNGDIVGLALNSNTSLKNNVSLSTGTNFYHVHGYSIDASSKNNYELEDSELTSNESGDKVKRIGLDGLTSDFFKNTVNFDENIWNLDNASYDNPPVLKFTVKESDEELVEKPSNNSLYIPDYNRIKKLNSYTASKEILYHNLNKLMPYYDARYLVEDGLKIAENDILNKKIIRHILPYNNGKMMTYLTSQNNNAITSIKVIFDDQTVENYDVTFKELKQNIAIYDIANLNVEYAYNNYVIKETASAVETIKNYINSVDYITVLDPLTETADHRIYKDNFIERLKPNLAETLTLQLLQNDSENVLTIDNSILNAKIKQQLVDSGRLNRILYAYNYYNRWYNFEIGGSNVADIIFFEGKIYKDSMTIDNLTDEVLTGNMGTNVTHAFYANNLKKYTGHANLGLFLDSIIANIGGYEDINDWFTEHFSSIGILSEIPVTNHPEVKYRAWDRIKGFQNFILPLSTLPKYAGYIISGPVQFQVGAQRVYISDPTTAAGQTTVKNIVKNHSNLIKRQFDTLAGSFQVESWNNFTILVYDTCKTITGYKTSYLPGTNIPIGTTPVTRINKVGTGEPFHRNFNEAVGAWQYGSAAGVGNTAGFLWFIASPGLTNFDTWTHEFEHALCDKIMMFRSGLRLRMENYTQGNVEQRENWSYNNIEGYDVGPYYFNLAFTLNRENLVTQNLTPERINTKEKLENYFKGQFDALELLDYVSAKAFITLTPEQQARIATRMAQSGSWSSWGTITTEQAESMNLTSLESLWDNKIILRPNNAWGVSVRGLVPINSIGGDDYGYESIWVTRWYMGHNDAGYSDALTNKKNMFEMLGYGGVNGYVTFGSRRSSTDLNAIQKITLAKTGTAMNWKEYRMSRYAEIESKRDNKYVNIDLMIEQFKEALKNDANNGNRNITNATNLRKLYYHYLKRATNDFIDDPLGTTLEMTHIKTAEELVQKINAQPYGYYILDNDIDFSGMTTNVRQTFMGKLDGNGHKIIGNTVTIFNKIRFGYVKDLTIENTNIPMNIANVGALSARTEYSVLENVKVNNLQLNFGGRNDLSLIAGAVGSVVSKDISVETLKNKITNISDFEKINQNPGGIFELEADLDFTGYTGTNSVITVPFTGKLDGKNHTVSNLNNLSLFSTINGTVENLNIKNFTNINPTSDDISAFAKLTNGATIKNVKFDNVTLEGRHRVAVVSAFDNANSKFERISVKGANVKASGVYVSTFIGRKYGGSIKDVYVEGNMEITTTENGGVVGAFQKGGSLENVVSRVSIHKTGNTYSNIAASEYNGGIIGNIYDKPTIKNSIALGNMVGFMSGTVEKIPYKLVGATATAILSTIENCYEYAGSTGFSSVTDETSAKIKVATDAEIHSKEFYKDTLHFDENVWNLDTVSSNGYPELK